MFQCNKKQVEKTLCVSTQEMNRLEKYKDNHLCFNLIIQLKYLSLEIWRYKVIQSYTLRMYIKLYVWCRLDRYLKLLLMAK